MLSSLDEVRARRARRRSGAGLAVPRLLVHLLPVLLAAAPWSVHLALYLLRGSVSNGQVWWLALSGASVVLLLLGLLLTVALRATLLVPVVRTTDAARRAAEGDAAAWPELETASGAAQDLGSALAGALRRSDALGGASRSLEELHEDVNRLAEEARAIAAGDWDRRPTAPSEETAPLADRLGAMAERSAELGRAAAALAQVVEQATAQAWEEAAPPDPGEEDLDDLADTAVEAAEALVAGLARAREILAVNLAAAAPVEAGGEREAGVEAAQRLGLLALNAALEAGKLGPGASRFVAVAEELGREAERARHALVQLEGGEPDDPDAEDPLGALATPLAELAEQAQELTPTLRQIVVVVQAAEASQEAVVRAGPSWPRLIERARDVRSELALLRIDGEAAEGGDTAPAVDAAETTETAGEPDPTSKPEPGAET